MMRIMLVCYADLCRDKANPLCLCIYPVYPQKGLICCHKNSIFKERKITLKYTMKIVRRSLSKSSFNLQQIHIRNLAFE